MRNRLPELLPGIVLDTQLIIIEQSLENQAMELILGAGFADKHILIVCDSNTVDALGKRIKNELYSLKVQLLQLPNVPVADDKTVELIRAQPYGALLAVGSGTINDLCKYASFLDKKPYAVFPTAPSMNGYLSANASITINHHKQTLAAHLPVAVFCDLSVIARAPKRLIASGLGDSLCRSTAQADWLLSHMLLNTPYNEVPFDLLMPYELQLFEHADKLVAGDNAVIELLVNTLLVSGAGMVLAGGSYPASQGEHLIAHTMEMKHEGNLPQSYHGEQIGVTTLTMAKLQHTLLERPLTLPKREHWEKTVQNYFGSGSSESVLKASTNKLEINNRADEFATILAEKSEAIQDAISRIVVPQEILCAVLAKVNAPLEAKALGWNETDYELAVRHARFIRDRFTFLDLL